MCGVTRRDTIRNEHIRGTTRVVQAPKKSTEKRLKRYGHVRIRAAHIVIRMLVVEIPGKRRRGRANLRWKEACRRDMIKAERLQNNKQGSNEEEDKQQYRRPPDDWTSQG